MSDKNLLQLILKQKKPTKKDAGSRKKARCGTYHLENSMDEKEHCDFEDKPLRPTSFSLVTSIVNKVVMVLKALKSIFCLFLGVIVLVIYSLNTCLLRILNWIEDKLCVLIEFFEEQYDAFTACDRPDDDNDFGWYEHNEIGFYDDSKHHSH